MCLPMVNNIVFLSAQLPGGGGVHLYLKLDIILIKNHVIWVVFQDQAMYVRTSFRGAKLEKKCVFVHSDKFWKGHDKQNNKNACKNTYLGSSFIPEMCV